MEANTVIFKWNPAISSVSMLDFLRCILQEEADSDWSVWDHERIRRGDTVYMLKVGYGQTGIVMRGKITSDPAAGEDWSGRGRQVFYCRYRADIMINPDAFPLLDGVTLRDNIPGFDWFGGHSGTVPDEKQSEVLARMWENYLTENKAEFRSRLDLIERRGMWNDQLYISPRFRTILDQ